MGPSRYSHRKLYAAVKERGGSSGSVCLGIRQAIVSLPLDDHSSSCPVPCLLLIPSVASVPSASATAQVFSHPENRTTLSAIRSVLTTRPAFVALSTPAVLATFVTLATLTALSAFVALATFTWSQLSTICLGGFS